MSRPSPSWYGLLFPPQVDAEQLQAFLTAAHGLSSGRGRDAFGLQLVAEAGKLRHFLFVPPGRRGVLLRHARSALPGLVLTETTAPAVTARRAWRLWLSTSRRPLKSDQPELVSRALLTTLLGLQAGEQVVLQWLLGPVRRPRVVPNRHPGVSSESWGRALATAAFRPPGDLDSEARQALRRKQGVAGWRAVGRLAVTAASAERMQSLQRGLLGALRTAEGPGSSLGVRPIAVDSVAQTRLPWVWNLALTTEELVGLSGWPLGELPELPLNRRASRLLPVPTDVPRRGRVLAVDPVSERPIAVSALDSRQHLWALGPTGTGKSTLLLNLIVQDLQAGRSVAVLEPKGDLISDVLARIPQERVDDVVHLDPADSAPVGFNPLASGAPPDLVADQLLTIVRGLNPDSWGPRLNEVLHTALLTLARTPGMSLPALPPLLTNDRFRRRLLAAVDDPLGVSPIWAAFERLSDEARAQAVASVLNKVRALTARPALRAVLGQAAPRFALSELFSGRRPVLLINLAKGVVGPDSARLLGTLLLNQLWQAALSRSAVAPERRHLVSVYVDELQDYASLPGDLGDMLAQARGLGVAFNLANQHLDQLPPALRSGALSNARTRIVFQTSADDGAVLTRGHRELSPEDVLRLGEREVYLRLSVGARVTPYLSGRTLPPPPLTSDPAEVRRVSRERHGVPAAETDAALEALIRGGSGEAPPIGRSRRAS